jgi:hypothetical protein
MGWRGSIFAVLVFLGGCSASMPHPQAKISHPEKDGVGTPYVLVIGDESVTAWGTPDIQQSHPLWTFAGSPLGTEETSGSVLARLPELLAAKHYDVVVVDVGVFDIASPTGNDFPGQCTGAVPTDTCYNLDQMGLLAHAAGAKILVCTLPYTTDPSIVAAYPEIEESESLFDRFLGEETDFDIDNRTQDGNVDLDVATEGVNWGGLLPNPAGAQVFTIWAETAIEQLKGNWGAK